jgi:hypothetical protein
LETQSGEGCSTRTYSGDWGDPFASGDVEEIVKSSTAPPGNETIHGVATKVYEATDPESKSRSRCDAKPNIMPPNRMGMGMSSGLNIQTGGR